MSPLTRIYSYLILISITFLLTNEVQADIEPRREKALTHIEEKASAPNYQDGPIKIVSWNIEWFPAGQRKKKKEFVERQMKAVAEIIHEIKPHILFTQETSSLGSLIRLNREYLDNKYKYLASSLYYRENTEGETKKVQQQTGLMSMFPWKEDIIEIEFANIDYYPTRPARGWLRSVIEIKGKKVYFYNGHLKSNFGSTDEEGRQKNYAKREGGMKYLEKDFQSLGITPKDNLIVVLGDFNTDYFSERFKDENTLKLLESWGFRHTFKNVPKEKRITVPARVDEELDIPNSTLDYIWLSEAWGESVPQAKVLQKGASKRKEVYGGDEDGLASDHYPVIVEIDIP